MYNVLAVLTLCLSASAPLIAQADVDEPSTPPSSAQATTAPADAPPSATTEAATTKDAAELRARLTKLESELAEMRARMDASPPPAPPLDLGNAREEMDGPSLAIHGMGHLQYDARFLETASAIHTDNHFTTGGLDLFLVSRLGESLRFFNETLFELGEGGVGILDVERVLFTWEQSDLLHLSVGRGHTALGYWNQQFHHGAWMQTSVDRPLLYAFEDEGGVLPVHFVGVEAAGAVHLPLFRLHYTATVANGRGLITDSVQVIEDLNAGKMVSASLRLEPMAVPGLGFGLTALTDQIPADPTSAARKDEIFEHILGAHAFYTPGWLELIAEGVVIFHSLEDIRAEPLVHAGGYALVAVRALTLRPYYRLDLIWIDPAGDPFFATAAEPPESLIGHTVGARWDVSVYAALKAELRRVDSIDGDAATEAAVQLSFTF